MKNLLIRFACVFIFALISAEVSTAMNFKKGKPQAKPKIYNITKKRSLSGLVPKPKSGYGVKSSSRHQIQQIPQDRDEREGCFSYVDLESLRISDDGKNVLKKIVNGECNNCVIDNFHALIEEVQEEVQKGEINEGIANKLKRDLAWAFFDLKKLDGLEFNNINFLAEFNKFFNGLPYEYSSQKGLINSIAVLLRQLKAKEFQYFQDLYKNKEEMDALAKSAGFHFKSSELSAYVTKNDEKVLSVNLYLTHNDSFPIIIVRAKRIIRENSFSDEVTLELCAFHDEENLKACRDQIFAKISIYPERGNLIYFISPSFKDDTYITSYWKSDLKRDVTKDLMDHAHFSFRESHDFKWYQKHYIDRNLFLNKDEIKYIINTLRLMDLIDTSDIFESLKK